MLIYLTQNREGICPCCNFRGRIKEFEGSENMNNLLYFLNFIKLLRHYKH